MLPPPRALIDAVPVGAISLDRGGTIREWNAAAELLFGWARSEVVGRVLSTVLKDEHGEPLADTLRGGSLSGAEQRVRTRSGALLDVAGIYGRAVTCYDIGYRIAPRINAVGRMGGASAAVDLLSPRR